MERYDYYEAVRDDVKGYLKENFTEEELKTNLLDYKARKNFEDKLQDDLWVEDSVTGNGSGRTGRSQPRKMQVKTPWRFSWIPMYP